MHKKIRNSPGKINTAREDTEKTKHLMNKLFLKSLEI